MVIILKNKVLEKLNFSKYVNNKKCDPKMIFFTEKFSKKVFDIEN